MTSLADLARQARAQGLIAVSRESSLPTHRHLTAADFDLMNQQPLGTQVKDRDGDTWELFEHVAGQARWWIVEFANGDTPSPPESRMKLTSPALHADWGLLKAVAHD